MKTLLLCLSFGLLFSSCEKKVEAAQEDIVLKIMTSGQWKVSSFMQGATDVTADFSGYKFQFKEDRTVDAIVNNSVQKTGSWQPNATARTITSNFSGSAHPLTLLIGTFTITDSGLTFVKAMQLVNGVQHSLRLDKI